MTPLNSLRDVVAGGILDRAEQVSDTLKELGVPHVLIGGLAVGLHGHPRVTKDVDFMVGDEAFNSTSPLLVYRDELSALLSIGYTDIMNVPPAYPSLRAELVLNELIPVISLPALILMKLDASRAQDRQDIRSLMKVHGSELRTVLDHLETNAPALLQRFSEVLAEK